MEIATIAPKVGWESQLASIEDKSFKYFPLDKLNSVRPILSGKAFKLQYPNRILWTETAEEVIDGEMVEVLKVNRDDSQTWRKRNK